MYPFVLPFCTVNVLFLFYFATDLAPKKTKAMTDRATSKKAKAYIYGLKEIRKLAALKETNIYVAKYMAYKPISRKTNRHISF